MKDFLLHMVTVICADTPKSAESRLSITCNSINLASYLWDLGIQHRPRCDVAECGIPSGVILFA